MLLKRHDIDIEKSDNIGTTPLFIACYQGNTTIVQALLEMQDLNINQSHSSIDATPLFIACKKGHTAIVKALLADSRLTSINKTNAQGITPLFIACLNGYIDIIRELLKHPNIDINSVIAISSCMHSHDINKEIATQLQLYLTQKLSPIQEFGIFKHTPTAANAEAGAAAGVDSVRADFFFG